MTVAIDNYRIAGGTEGFLPICVLQDARRGDRYGHRSVPNKCDVLNPDGLRWDRKMVISPASERLSSSSSTTRFWDPSPELARQRMSSPGRLVMATGIYPLNCCSSRKGSALFELKCTRKVTSRRLPSDQMVETSREVARGSYPRPRWQDRTQKRGVNSHALGLIANEGLHGHSRVESTMDLDRQVKSDPIRFPTIGTMGRNGCLQRFDSGDLCKHGTLTNCFSALPVQASRRIRSRLLGPTGKDPHCSNRVPTDLKIIHPPKCGTVSSTRPRRLES